MFRFEVGQIYNSTCFFTGGTTELQIIARNKKENETYISVTEVNYEIDGISKPEEPQTYAVLNDGNREYFVIQEYKGAENRIYVRAPEER